MHKKQPTKKAKDRGQMWYDGSFYIKRNPAGLMPGGGKSTLF